MAAPRKQAESRGPSAALFWVVLGVMITASGIMLSAVYFVGQTYAENVTSNQALSQRISNTEATLLARIHNLEGNVIETRNEIVGMRIEIMEIREISESIIARLDALNVGGRIKGGVRDGLSPSPSTPGEGGFQINGTPPALRDTERGS